MNMNINGISKAYKIYDAKERVTSAERVSRLEEKKDMVAISSQASDFCFAKAAVANAPDIRAEKVASIKNKIANNQYKIDPRSIANKLLV